MKIILENGVEIILPAGMAGKVLEVVMSDIKVPPQVHSKSSWVLGGKVAKRAEKPALVRQVGEKRYGYTPEEQRNIIELYKRGESPKSIAKKFEGKTPANISSYIFILKKKGLIESRPSAYSKPDILNKDDADFED